MRALPTITTKEQILPQLKKWERSLNSALHRPLKPRALWDLTVTSKRGGNLLEWGELAGTDGYEIEIDATGEFESPLRVNVPNARETSYFDSTGGVVVKRYYRVRATAGTETAPQVVKGSWSGIVVSTSIDSNDTTTPSTTTRDEVGADVNEGAEFNYKLVIINP